MTFEPGQHVTARIYGEIRHGIVTRTSPNGEMLEHSPLVWVQWEGRKHESWMHPESLTLARKLH